MRPHEGLTFEELGRLLEEARDKDDVEKFFSSIEADAKKAIKKKGKKLSEEEKQRLLNVAQELRFVWGALLGREDDPLGLAYARLLISATYFAASHGLGKAACPQSSTLGSMTAGGKKGGEESVKVRNETNAPVFEREEAAIKKYWEKNPTFTDADVKREIPLKNLQGAFYSERTVGRRISAMKKKGYVPPPDREGKADE